MTSLASTAASLVTRARAGDQNAAAMIRRVGEEARQGNNSKASAAYAAIERFIKKNAAREFVLGAEDEPEPSNDSIVAAASVVQTDPEANKPAMPPGALDGILDPETFVTAVLGACRYRHGLNAAALVLASGPPLTKDAVEGICASNFEGDEGRQLFAHGVRFSSDLDWRRAAPSLQPHHRRCLAIGQCVGRARRIQMVRQPGSPISRAWPSIGWELGE